MFPLLQSKNKRKKKQKKQVHPSGGLNVHQEGIIAHFLFSHLTYAPMWPTDEWTDTDLVFHPWLVDLTR